MGCWGGGGGALAVFVCLFGVAQHWFHSQSPSRTMGQDTRDSSDLRWTIVPVFIVNRLAFSRLVTSSRSLGCCRSKNITNHIQNLGLPCMLTDHYTWELRRKEVNKACQCACPDGIAPSKIST